MVTNVIVANFDLVQQGITLGLLVTVCAGIGGWLVSLGVKVFRVVGG
ncbi:MAG: hypothetical protein ABFD08_02640 [Syntrophomonas sp.]